MLPRRVQLGGQTKIYKYNAARLCHDDIRWFNVSV